MGRRRHYDQLVNAQILSQCSARAECVYVGKSIGTPGKPRQVAINSFLIEHAKAGKKVVRLKGGDPFVFWRGGEEMLALAEAGIEFEVVILPEMLQKVRNMTHIMA